MPAVLTVQNSGREILKVDLQASYLVTGADERRQGLALDEAIDRALRSDAEVVLWDILFGAVGTVTAMDHVTGVNRTLEEDYHAKYFRPTLINAGQSGKGVIFFDRATVEKERVRSAVLVLGTVGSGETMEVTIPLPKDVAD